jgi:hypothetical protein
VEAVKLHAQCTFDLLLESCCSCMRPKLWLMGCRVLSSGICCLAAAPCCADGKVMLIAQPTVCTDCNIMDGDQCEL